MGEWTFEDEVDKLIPEDTTLSADVTGVEKRSWKRQDGSEFEKAQFSFRITSDDFNGARVGGGVPIWTTDSGAVSKNSPLFGWVRAILNTEVPSGFSLDPDDLLDMPCRVIVGQYTNKDGVVRNFVKQCLSAKDSGDAASSSFDSF
jgi:hypothetical protein